MGRPVPEENDLSHEALGLVSLCKAYNVLPRAGGMLDQDSLFVWIANVYERASMEKQEADSAKSKSQAAKVQAARRR